MAIEFLKGLFGTNEDGTPKAMTWEELDSAVTANKDLKVVDLSAGGYVSKDKFDSQETKLKGIQKQLTDANATIQSYKDMDVDGIKKSASDWEQKYNTDTAALNDKITAMELDFAQREYLAKFDFADDLAKEGVAARFKAQNFKRDKDGVFEGADEYMEGLKKSNPNAFKTAQQPGKPQFAPEGGGNPPSGGNKKMSLDEIMAYANANPGCNIDALIDENIKF